MRSLDIQGHRGARGLLPENTLPAFARALSIGVSTLELDCAITRDGVVVVSHDSTLNPEITRGDDGAWITRADLPISQYTYDELRRFDVGRIDPASDYARRFPHQQPIDGTRMPKLEDVFALAQKACNDTVRFNIETKLSPLHPERTVAPEAFAQSLIAVIQRHQMQNRAMVQSFDWRTLAVVQAEAPEIAARREAYTKHAIEQGVFGAPSWRAAEREAIERATFWLEQIGLKDRADDAAHVDFNRFIADVAARYSLAIVRRALRLLAA